MDRPKLLFAAHPMDASFSSVPIDTIDWQDKRLSLTLSWPADAGNAGSTVGIETSDDPRVGSDFQAGSDSADWIPRTFPSGSVDGVEVVAAGTTITLTANAGASPVRHRDHDAGRDPNLAVGLVAQAAHKKLRLDDQLRRVGSNRDSDVVRLGNVALVPVGDCWVRMVYESTLPGRVPCVYADKIFPTLAAAMAG